MLMCCTDAEKTQANSKQYNYPMHVTCCHYTIMFNSQRQSHCPKNQNAMNKIDFMQVDTHLDSYEHVYPNAISKWICSIGYNDGT